MEDVQNDGVITLALPRQRPRIKVPALSPKDFTPWFQQEAIKFAEKVYLDRHVPVEWQYKVMAEACEYADAISEPKKVYDGAGILVDIVYNAQWKKVVEAFVKIVTEATQHKVREHHII